MKILCLIKQIPRPDAIEFDQETKSLKREGVPLELNRFDAQAVIEGARLRDEHGGEVVAMAIEKEGCDLVLCGRKTLDSETWQVPPEVAAFLGRPHATNAFGLTLDGERLRISRETDDGEETVELPLPAVVSVTRADREARERTDENGRIDVWTATDLVDDVRENDKRFGQTGSPTRVLAVRDVAPDRLGERPASVADAAERLRELAAQRPAGETAWEKPAHLGEEPGASFDCWTLVETVGGRASRASLELLAKGRELSGKLGGLNVALVLGSDVAPTVDDVTRHGAELVHVGDHESLRHYVPEPWVAAVSSIVRHERPHVLLIPATVRGRDLGPRVAGELQLGMTGDCVDLGIDRGGRLIQHKPAYGGNIVSVIMGATTPQLATVRPRMFELLEHRETEAEVRKIELGELPEGRTVLERSEIDPPPWRLDAADIVVGIGDSVEPAELVDAATRAGAAIGGDHRACVAGLIPPSLEIGLLGRAVAPRIYIAVETDGSFEHLTGTVKAGAIAAITGDESSPLLDAADIVLVGDWRELAPALLETLA